MSRILALTAALLLWPACALAQDWAGPLSPSVFPSWIGQDPIGMALRNPTTDSAGPAPADRARPTPRPAPRAAPVSLRFTPSLERRRANLDAFLARSRRVDAQSAEQLAALFARGDFIETIGASLRPYGLRTDDLADAYAVWWINVWDAAHLRTEQASAGRAAAVRAQTVQAMSATPAFRDADDARRQELAETLLIQAVLISEAADQARGDPAVGARVARLAAQNARQMGVDVNAMTLTDEGFVFE